MKKNRVSRVSDISRVMNRAAFADVEQMITKYKYGSDAFMRILESRYSCHAFNHHAVSEAKLEMILESARLAPSAKNLQPTHVWVLKSEEALEAIRTVHSCYGAPVVFVIGCKKEEGWVRPYDGVNAAKTDAAIVLTHMMLTATDMDLANMWIWDFDPNKVREAFPQMKEYGIYGLLAVGHPAASEGQPTERHTQRKSLEELVTIL